MNKSLSIKRKKNRTNMDFNIVLSAMSIAMFASVIAVVLLAMANASDKMAKTVVGITFIFTMCLFVVILSLKPQYHISIQGISREMGLKQPYVDIKTVGVLTDANKSDNNKKNETMDYLSNKSVVAKGYYSFNDLNNYDILACLVDKDNYLYNCQILSPTPMQSEK